MQFLHSYLKTSVPRKISFVRQNMAPFNGLSLTPYDGDILFANSSSPKRPYDSKEIRDESGLGSGAGITPEDQARFDRQTARPDNEQNSVTDDDGATGPGGDRTGDKMAGEGGVTDVTDGIARFIDDLEDEDSEKGRSKK